MVEKSEKLSEASTASTIPAGTIHSLPISIEKTLMSNIDVLDMWNNLTPLARNERICRVTMPKQEETKQKHLVRLVEDIRSGKKRPCCWPGCPHHRESAKKRFSKI